MGRFILFWKNIKWDDFMNKWHQSLLVVVVGFLLSGSAGLAGKKVFFPLRMSPAQRLALTFDDGPHEGYTEAILSALRAQGVKATFFVVGSQAKKFPHLVEKIVREGHEVANHSYTHTSLTKIPVKKAAEEISKPHQLLERLVGRPCQLFRPPGGRFNADIHQMVLQQGLDMVLWSVLPRDHTNPPEEVIISRVLSGVKDGGVVLLHSGVDSTVSALPKLISHLRDNGYGFYTVSDLIKEEIDEHILSEWYWPAVREDKHLTVERDAST